ncbi:hypothetical protein HRR78_006160 [Exophiala dermatitidis]|nr:hypothetical protein HRR75_006405 [Exophiala dermatitidis]KAJ4545438.1 hypothetical protein HRR78_006160 [Exophiala dermatitidis]
MSRPGLEHRPSSIAAANKTIVLVTGGNAGIGYEIVKKLATENPDFQVLMGCRDTRKGEDAVASMGAPTNVNPIQLDITDDESIEHCFLAIEQNFGKLDILINNAATAAQHLPPTASLREKFDVTFNVNVTSTAVLTDRLLPLLEKSKLPKIIFVSSGVGSITDTLEKGPPWDGIWYNSSKTALNAIMAFYAKKHPTWKVNAVCPGYRATGLNGAEMTEERHPKHGATRVAELVAEGPGGALADTCQFQSSGNDHDRKQGEWKFVQQTCQTLAEEHAEHEFEKTKEYDAGSRPCSKAVLRRKSSGAMADWHCAKPAPKEIHRGHADANRSHRRGFNFRKKIGS